MIVGFTGTQTGMTGDQALTVGLLLRVFGEGKFHHGGCVGADVQAAFLARCAGFLTTRHPGDTPSKQDRGFVDDEVLDVFPNLVRNHRIVDSVEAMIAAPSGPEVVRSGTWATVRYARRWEKPLTIVWPDGSM